MLLLLLFEVPIDDLLIVIDAVTAEVEVELFVSESVIELQLEFKHAEEEEEEEQLVDWFILFISLFIDGGGDDEDSVGGGGEEELQIEFL